MNKSKTVASKIAPDHEFQEVLVIFESRVLIGESLRILFSHKNIFRDVYLAHDLNHPIFFELSNESVVYLISGTSYPQIWKCIQFITQISTNSTVVILDEHFRCGSGYFLKHFHVHGYWTCFDSSEQLVQGLVDAVERQKSLSQHTDAFLAHSESKGVHITSILSEHPLYKLSRREEQLFRLIAAGWSFSQCVDEMKITPKALRNLRKRLMNKFGLTSETELIWKAIELGFVDWHNKGHLCAHFSENASSRCVHVRYNLCCCCNRRDFCDSCNGPDCGQINEKCSD